MKEEGEDEEGKKKTKEKGEGRKGRMRKKSRRV